MTKKNNFSYLHNLIFLTQIGLTMIIPILGGVILGSYLDRRFSNENIFVIVFTIMGVFVSYRNVFLLTKNEIRKKENHKDE